jgi:CHAD domain-containing protein
MKKRKVPIRWAPEQTPPENARRRLWPVVHEWFAAGRKAVGAGQTPEEMHQFRLATKRLRYTLELFRPIYGRGLAQRIEVLRRAQDLLGTANDYHVTALGLKSRAQYDPALQPVVDELERRAGEKRAEFRRYWLQNCTEPVVEPLWINYLKRNAGGRRPQPHP